MDYHFDFSLTVPEAENFLSLFQDRINKNNIAIMDAMVEGKSQEIINCYKADIEYTEQLKAKIIQNMGRK